MNKLSLACLAALAALVTGCPHNEYIVELAPHGNVIKRKLVFFRADGADTNGVPNYQSFPSNELAAISALYPPGSVTRDGERHVAKGEFAGAMPCDVGGAGSYKNLTTSLGSAGFYVERFRGNDDLSAQTTQRLAAADQLTDLVLGWSRKEFSREAGYKNLRHFLDTDFRRDLKNLGMYAWGGEISDSCKTNGGEEFIVRFGQYLVERGYVKLNDTPEFHKVFQDSVEVGPYLARLLQRFVAEKLGLPASQPMPESLVFLADPVALQKSWEKFLSGTDSYHAKLREWKKEKKSQPDLQQPKPSSVEDALVASLMEFGSAGGDDHLSAKLSLPSAPTHTNGKWDETHKQVLWESGLEDKEKAVRLPVFCYASWSNPDEEFQQQHFGRVILGGDELLKYCLWRGGLDEAQGSEWDQFLSDLRPGGELTMKLDAFQFSGGTRQNSSAADFGKGLIKPALEQKP
jgi:hypothetical protein